MHLLEPIKLKFLSSSMRPDLIGDEIMKTKTSTYLTNGFFPCSLLKLTPHMFKDLLSYLFYSIAESRCFPAIWKVAYVRPKKASQIQHRKLPPYQFPANSPFDF